MDKDYIFTVIGKLYFDIISAQQAIESLQEQNKEKDKIIQELRAKELIGNNES
jgi:hypothetical protein